ncbi:unnamed protein product, partial [Ectocarpus sp. 12 AP-2014]
MRFHWYTPPNPLGSRKRARNTPPPRRKDQATISLLPPVGERVSICRSFGDVYLGLVYPPCCEVPVVSHATHAEMLHSVLHVENMRVQLRDRLRSPIWYTRCLAGEHAFVLLYQIYCGLLLTSVSGQAW